MPEISVNKTTKYSVEYYTPENSETKYVSIRRFIQKKDGTWIPTKQGLTFPEKEAASTLEKCLEATLELTTPKKKKRSGERVGN